MIVLHFDMPGEDIVKCTNDKCQVFAFKCARGIYSRAYYGEKCHLGTLLVNV